jgi:superfamily II DNA or RNA helicase
VICDEHHHSAVEAVWGKSTNDAFASARFAILLTGTPIRSDGAESVWLAYDNEGAIDHPEEGTYTLTYGEAVDFNYCRPVTFHRHEGKFSVVLGNNSSIKVSGHKPAVFPRRLKRISQLQNALNFYKLACKPQYQKDLTTPLINGYQGTMLQAGSDELTDLRHRMPNAGGLVIAPTIEMAEYMAKLLELIEGETPILVHSLMPNPDGKIKAFRNTKKRWIVSVAMISEGVDIKRLRVLVYLPTATTELAFRQALGRVVRTAGPEDDTRAYVVMPRFETFERYALRVEDEMPASLRRPQKPPRLKRCGSCGHECPLSAEECPLCGYEFPPRIEHTKLCDECNAINPASAKTCHACGTQFGHDFILTLDDALREGVISRGMDIDEAETQEAERLAPRIRSDVMRSGDQRLVRIIQSLPPESWARLSRICNTQKESK